MIKKISIVSIIIIGTITLFAYMPKSPSRTNTLIVGTNAMYPPYESYNIGGAIEGFDIDIAHAIAQKLGKELIIQDISFDSLILALKQGKIDIILSGMSITKSRQAEIAMIPYQGKMVKQLALAFWQKIPTGITSLENIASSSDPTVSVQVGTYQEIYVSNLKGISVKSLESTTDLIMDLQYGKSAATLLEPHIATVLKKKFPQLQVLPIDLPENAWVLGNGIGINKQNHALIKDIQNAVNELKEEGVITQYAQKWLEEKQ